ncbi:MAG: hypothetical protein IKQ35_02100 [Bacilli bacterium]|nr:hypothetical protein [Bacilli bacterium]
MKKKVLFIEIILINLFEHVYAINKISCGTTSGIPEALPEFIRTVVTLIKYLVPLGLILFGSVDLLKVVFGEDKKGLDKAVKKFLTRSAAGVIVFFVVFVTLLFFENMDNSSSTAECIKCFTVDKDSCKVYYEEDEDHSAEKEEDNKKRQELEKKREENREKNKKDADKEKKEASKEKDPDNILNGYRNGNVGELDFTCTSKTVKSRFSCETLAIVEQHLYDFDSTNFKSTIKSKYGNFANYMSSLGGVFADFYGRKISVHTATELQWVSEYVFGMMYMYGFDYYNGINRKYCKWGGNCVQMKDFFNGSLPNSATNDAFWKGTRVYFEEGLSEPKSNFDKLISDLDSLNKNTNCNWTVDMVYNKAGIFHNNRTKVNSSASYKAMGKAKGNKVITNVEDLQIGDIVHFFESCSNRADPDTWHDWYHVAFIGEIDRIKKTVTVYDGGSRYTNNRNFKIVAKLDNRINKLNGTSCWAAVRVVDIMQE